MIPGTTLPTPYANRLKLVQDTMTMYSVLDDDAAANSRYTYCTHWTRYLRRSAERRWLSDPGPPGPWPRTQVPTGATAR